MHSAVLHFSEDWTRHVQHNMWFQAKNFQIFSRGQIQHDTVCLILKLPYVRTSVLYCTYCLALSPPQPSIVHGCSVESSSQNVERIRQEQVDLPDPDLYLLIEQADSEI